MENNELKELFIKFNKLENCERTERYIDIKRKIYNELNINYNLVEKQLNTLEENILLKSIYLIEFYEINILQKPINNLLYFIMNNPVDREELKEQIKDAYIEQAKLLIKHLDPEK